MSHPERTGTFEHQGQSLGIEYIDSSEVTPGVVCHVYRFKDDDSRDLGIIEIQPGFKTPLQKILEGEHTFEGLISGKGTLTVTDTEGEETIYHVDEELGMRLSVEVHVGETVQWQATPNSILVVCEICHPPYQNGRFENLPEENS